MFSTIGTYQTLNNAERLKKFDPSKYKLVIVDEAHHAAAISSVQSLSSRPSLIDQIPATFTLLQ
jgi:superfamily II DNA or RNA helicase